MKDTSKSDEATAITTKMTRNHLARSTSQQQLNQTSPHHHHQQQQQQHQANKWTTKERLFLVSCVLINGESNWSFISDQLNKWMKFTTNCMNIPFSSNLSLLGANSTILSTINLRTNNQCSKQYKFIVKNYSSKYGINDLKKVYNHLADERLKELKNLVLNSRQQFTDVFNEIDQLFEMDSNNFEQLTEIWNHLKNAESSLYSNRSNYETRSCNEIRNSDTFNQIDHEEIVKMEKNIEKIQSLNRKRKEEAEAAILAAKKAAEAEQAARDAAAAALAEAQRIQNISINQEQKAKQHSDVQAMQIETETNNGNKILTENEESNIPSQTETSSSIKIEQNVFMKSEQTESNEDVIPKMEDTQIQSYTEPNADKTASAKCTENLSSDDEIPLSKLYHNKKNQKKSESKEVGIEWKPVVDNTDDPLTANSNADLLLDDDDEDDDEESDTELVVKKPKNTFLSPRKPPKIIEVSSSSSDNDNDTNSARVQKNSEMTSAAAATSLASTSAHLESPVKTKSEENTSSAPTTIPSTPASVPSRKSTRNRNSLSASSISNREGSNAVNRNEEQTELIFTPLIKYNNEKIEAEDKSTPVSKIDETGEASGLHSDKEEKNGAESGSKSKRKSKMPKQILKPDDPEAKQTTGEQDLTMSEDNEEEPEEPSTRASSLRSKQKTHLTNAINKQQQRRSSSVQQTKGSKSNSSLIVSVTPQTKLSGRNTLLLSPKPAISSDEMNVNLENISAENLQSKDTGLLSIKCEPVQISASSTIMSNDLDSKDENLDANGLNNRSSRNKESFTIAPFSSSSSSSILSNNSFNSLAMNKFEDEKAYRAWKKSILMVLNNINCHKHATVFMHPVRDDIAPGYSSVVRRPIDLGTMKKNIENGSIKSTKEFQRDIMLMFTNAIMYNSSGHDVHKISVEMYKEVLVDVEQLLNAQEAMGEEQKPLRFKDKRSSTASDRGVIPGIEIERNESSESTNEPVVNILMTTKKETFNKDEALETASLNSSSSVSQPINMTHMSSSKAKFDSNLSCSTSVSTTTSTSTSNTKKRRPSSESSQTQRESSKEQGPKSKKRRKSGR